MYLQLTFPSRLFFHTLYLKHIKRIYIRARKNRGPFVLPRQFPSIPEYINVWKRNMHRHWA